MVYGEVIFKEVRRRELKKHGLGAKSLHWIPALCESW
jgi:hypothetical protein